MKTKTTRKWIYNRLKPFIPWVILISLLNITSSIVYIGLAKISQRIIDTATTMQNSLIMGGVFLFSLIIVHLIIEASVSIMTAQISAKMNIHLRNYMFTSLMKKKYSNIAEYHSGDLLNRFSSDVDVVVNGSIGLIPSVVSMLTKIIVGVFAICVENYRFAFIVVIVGFTFPLIGRILSRRYKEIHKAVQQTEGKTRSFLQESFANIIVIKTFTGEKPFLLKLNEHLETNRKLKIKKSILSTAISISLYMLFSFGYYGVLVWGAGQISKSVITVGTLFYFLQLISILRAPLQNISGIVPRYYSTLASAERLIELEKLEDEKTLKINSEIKNFNQISADKLTFAYENEIVLKDCCFNIKRNTLTAVTGLSGSGKSTLFKLLLGLYSPTYGTLTFDGKSPINETTRQMFSYVPQGNMVISGTIKENISLCDSRGSDEDIIKAAKDAVIYDFISSLPDGFNTVLSERGQGLSEGQIQRIAIARALLFNAPIILLDEATSALDEQTEAQLLKNLKEFTDKTIIFITHRNTSLSICDNILHLSNGSFEIQ